MCGISLIINKGNNPVEESQIRRMTDKVIHRGPDDEGYYFGRNFAFGHRRLSIIDLSDGGHQPMQKDNYGLIYNGEIYNYIELIEELKKLGHIFKTHCDTEVIFPAYWEWGSQAFHKFNGMWAFILYDAANQEIILCRDRFGVKPLFFTQVGDTFLAGSEIKQFTVFPEFKSVLNKNVAINFLVEGWLNYSDETFFEGVYELRPGHYMRYNLKTHQSTIHQWYDLQKAIVPVKATEEKAVEKVRELLKDSIYLRMRSDVQVGSCLSGGIDSSSIVSLVHHENLANENFTTVTSCYIDKEYDEQYYSDEVSKQTGFKSVKVFPDLKLLFDENLLDKMLYHQEQPFSGASHYSEFCVFKAARENDIVVLLDGQGSDECFYGYGEFYINYIRSMMRKGKWRKAWRNMRYKANLHQTGILKQWQIFFKSAYWHRSVGAAKNLMNETHLPWLKDYWRKTAEKTVMNFNEKDIHNLSIQQIKYSSMPFQLHSADRNSMCFSLEVREPFMDYRLIEYVIGLPDEYKIKNGFSKHVLREAVYELPPDIKYRPHKMGFVAPDKPWMLSNSKRIRKELEDSVAHTGFFSDDLIKRYDLFANGELGYDSIYFRAIALNRFCKIFSM